MCGHATSLSRRPSFVPRYSRGRQGERGVRPNEREGFIAWMGLIIDSALALAVLGVAWRGVVAMLLDVTTTTMQCRRDDQTG